MLDTLEKLFSIITGVLTIFITVYLIFVGQAQFRANLAISEEQLKLYKLERQSGIPMLAVDKTVCVFTPQEDYYAYKLTVKNYGERPADSIRIQLYAVNYDIKGKLIIIDKFDEIAANPMTKDMQWDVTRDFKTDVKEKIFIYTFIEYSDSVLGIKKSNSYLFFIPPSDARNKVEGPLSNASLSEMDTVKKLIIENR